MNYLLKKEYLNQILSGLCDTYEVYAPQKKEGYSHFLRLEDPERIVLEEPHNTRFPPKAFLLPQSETLLKYKPHLGELSEIKMEEKDRIIFGIRPCDASAVQLLDSIFKNSDDTDPYWKTRKNHTFLIGLGCTQPCSTCFCTTVGSGPFDKTGLDVLFTDIGEAYAIETFTEDAVKLFSQLPQALIDQLKEKEIVQKNAFEKLPVAFETEGLKKHLDHIFETDIWKDFAESCLGCGICTFLCPTCFCFDIVDEVQRGERVRNWDTCMFRIYSQETSGHNPRPTRAERTRQRLMHKFSYWLDHIDKIGCTGCGRCVRYCPVGLDIRQMIRKASDYKSEVVRAN